MKRVISLILILAMVLSFTACNKVVQNTEPITIYVGLGNTTGGYYDSLKSLIKSELGIDVQFIYNNTLDTTTSVNQMIENGDLPADIVITASRTNEEAQKNAFLDLTANTNIPDLFTTEQITQIAIDGSVYQLPFSTRLIGIEYNKTLFEEYDLELPDNFEEMVALKEQADSLGLKFAVSGGIATGHGFNYLFHLLGTDYIYGSASGTEWLTKFRSGEATVDEFADAATYFEKFAKAGLFGSFHNEDWNSSTEFKETRALFYFNITNDAYSYDGFQYDDDGKIVGATYNGDQVVVEEAEDGNAVEIDGKYVLYDEENADHEGLTRYNIPGAVVLHDTYASMPWISENGSSNCYTAYNNMYVAVNKNLGTEENKDRLATIIKILEFMTTDKATKLFTDMFPDGYVSVSSFKIDDSRLYTAYSNSIKKGYVQPWYYNEFDLNSIDTVGKVVNNYILGNDTFDNIISTLDECNKAYVNSEVEALCTVSETLDYADVAKLQCVANGLSAQKTLDDNGIDIDVTVSILPYTDALSSLPVGVQTPIVQSKMYKGDFETTAVSSLVQATTNTPSIVKMSGKEINALVSDGYNTKDEFGVDHVFSIAMMTKNNVSIDESKDYYVVIPSKVLGSDYDSYLSSDAVVMLEDKELTGTTVDGISLYFENHSSISKSNIEWK